MKTKTMSLTTKKTIPEISDDLRRATSKLHAHPYSPATSPFGNMSFRQSNLSVILCGSNFILGGPRKWGVQISVFEQGSTRSVELIAVGDDLSGKLSNGSFGKPFFELRDSTSRMNSIFKMLNEH